MFQRIGPYRNQRSYSKEAPCISQLCISWTRHHETDDGYSSVVTTRQCTHFSHVWMGFHVYLAPSMHKSTILSASVSSRPSRSSRSMQSSPLFQVTTACVSVPRGWAVLRGWRAQGCGHLCGASTSWRTCTLSGGKWIDGLLQCASLLYVSCSALGRNATAGPVNAVGVEKRLDPHYGCFIQSLIWTRHSGGTCRKCNMHQTKSVAKVQSHMLRHVKVDDT